MVLKVCKSDSKCKLVFTWAVVVAVVVIVIKEKRIEIIGQAERKDDQVKVCNQLI